MVVLCEYDLAQQPPLDFFGDGASRTFPEAMQALGYHSVLLESPHAETASLRTERASLVFDDRRLLGR